MPCLANLVELGELHLAISDMYGLAVIKLFRLLSWDRARGSNTLIKYIASLAKAPGDRELYELLQWTLANTNAFYRGLHCHAMWIPHHAAKRYVQNAWSMTAPVLHI